MNWAHIACLAPLVHDTRMTAICCTAAAMRGRRFDFDFQNHIRTFSPDKRRGLFYDLRKIRERNPALAE